MTHTFVNVTITTLAGEVLDQVVVADAQEPAQLARAIVADLEGGQHHGGITGISTEEVAAAIQELEADERAYAAQKAARRPSE